MLTHRTRNKKKTDAKLREKEEANNCLSTNKGFGYWKILKCLENGPFGVQKWVKNGSKMWVSKNDLGAFEVHKPMK